MTTPNDVPYFKDAEFSRTVKLLLEETGTPLSFSIVDKPWCVAPGLIYSICKLERSLVEAFKEENNLPDAAIKKYISNNLLFDIPNSPFKTLSSGRELLVFDSEDVYNKFLDFCVTLELRGSNISWRVLAAHLRIRDPINADTLAEPNVAIAVLCPFDEQRSIAYAPEYHSPVAITPYVVKQKVDLNG